MAKKSAVNRNEMVKALVAKYADKRAALKATLDGFLSGMVLDEMLTGYTLDVTRRDLGFGAGAKARDDDRAGHSSTSGRRP